MQPEMHITTIFYLNPDQLVHVDTMSQEGLLMSAMSVTGTVGLWLVARAADR